MNSNRTMFLAGCGLLIMYWGLAVSTAPANAYVRTKPALTTAPSVLPTKSLLSADVRSRSEAPLQTLPEDQVVQIVQDPTFTSFSISALFLSVSALVLSLWKTAQPVAVAGVVGTNSPRADETPESVPQRVEDAKSNQMDAVALSIKADLERSKALTPKEAILELQRGNARFWSGNPERPELNAMERRAQIIAQAPTVCILSCADSRVPVELVFDQGLGRIFVVRVAGNIVDSSAIGSIEFAVKYLGVKVLLVMGHEACGAVKGAMTMSGDDLENQPSYLKSVLLQIKANLNLDQLKKIQDSRAQDREAIVTNVSSQVKKLQQNPLIAERSADGSLLVAGAFYEITSGIVDFYTLDKNGLVTDI